MTTGSVYSLIYMSTALKDYPTTLYEDIAVQSFNNNKKFDITGLLLVKNGLIVQFLEGKSSDLEALYSNIERDDRHSNPTVLMRRTLDGREFPDWSMGFEVINTQSTSYTGFRLTTSSLHKAIRKPISAVSAGFLTAFSKASGLCLT